MVIQNSHKLELQRVAGRIGASIEGFRLSADLPDDDIEEVRSAVMQHKVVFFRGQHLDAPAQEALVRRFGKPTGHPTLGTQIVRAIDGGIPEERANIWHTDATFTPAVTSFSFLRAEIVPDVGGDTMWASTAAGYADLPEELARLADSLWAVHNNSYDDVRGTRSLDEAKSDYSKKYANRLLECVHPVVHVIPETGERAMLLGNTVRRFVGFQIAESQQILSVFQQYILRPENTMRWKWRVGDMAVYDNRATQHYAINDYGDRPRRMQTARVEGTPLTGVDGRSSYSLT